MVWILYRQSVCHIGYIADIAVSCYINIRMLSPSYPVLYVLNKLQFFRYLPAPKKNNIWIHFGGVGLQHVHQHLELLMSRESGDFSQATRHITSGYQVTRWRIMTHDSPVTGHLTSCHHPRVLLRKKNSKPIRDQAPYLFEPIPEIVCTLCSHITWERYFGECSLWNLPPAFLIPGIIQSSNIQWRRNPFGSSQPEQDALGPLGPWPLRPECIFSRS